MEAGSIVVNSAELYQLNCFVVALKTGTEHICLPVCLSICLLDFSKVAIKDNIV